MKKSTRTTTFAVATAALFVVGMGGGTVVANAAITDSTASISIPAIAVNADGLAFGSALSAKSEAELPDLILVVANSGREGYVFQGDLASVDGSAAAKAFKSPEDALAWQDEWQRTSEAERTIPVYESDSRTVVGDFTVQLGRGDVVSFRSDRPSHTLEGPLTTGCLCQAGFGREQGASGALA